MVLFSFFSSSDCDALMNLDESDVDGIAMDKIGNVGDLFDAESTPLMSLMSAEPAAPSAAERDEVDGQTFLSFVSFKDLEHFSQHNAATDGGRLVRARFNKSAVATTSQLLASRRPRVLDIRLKTGQVISEAHARFAASALRIRPMANAGAVPVTNASANAGTAPEINAPAKSGAAPSADASAVRKAVGGRPRKSRSPPPPTSADCLVDPVTQQQITVLHEDYEEHYGAQSIQHLFRPFLIHFYFVKYPFQPSLILLNSMKPKKLSKIKRNPLN